MAKRISKDTLVAMDNAQPYNPLHGITLKQIVTELHEFYGWDALAEHVSINCFQSNPSIKSSLKFLRRTPWARDKVEHLYLETIVER